MLFATHPHLVHFRLLALLVIFGGLASGCQSSRASFSFRPELGRGRPMAATMQVAATKDSLAAPIAPAVFAARPVGRVQRQARRVRSQVQSVVVSPMESAVIIARTSVEHYAATHRRGLLRRPHPTAEVGLGTTVLGVLGLVALPIALIGLLLSGGGLVWGIVAGAAALAVLVAYIDPFG